MKLLKRLIPFGISLIVTWFALLVGITLISPDGAKIFPGVLVFPFGAILFALIGWLDDKTIFYAILFLMLVQYPIYGIVLSFAVRKGRVFAIIAVVHIIVAILAVVLFFQKVGWNRIGDFV